MSSQNDGIRKAVRAWAKANGFEDNDQLRYTFTEELEVVSFDNGTNLINIMFYGFPDGIDGLIHGKYYTIAELNEKLEDVKDINDAIKELCGEEE